MSHPVLVEVMRGGIVESAHRGSAVVVDADGAVLAAVGDVDRAVFPRSAVKALQALPLVESGAADRLGLTDEELALACSSHNGEDAHVRTAAVMLAKAGVDEAVLECGTQLPSEARAQALAASSGPLHNNCSGKHAGFVCLGCMLAGAPSDPDVVRRFVAGYVRAEHPLMREVTAALQAATGFDPARAPVGVDGCSIPTYAIALRRLALAFARFGTGVGLSAGHARAARRLRAAVTAAPFMVAGSGRFDTRVIERLGERVFCKVGAEGVYCAALPQQGLGIAVKVDDGSPRAAEVAVAALIARFAELDGDARSFIDALVNPVLRNWNGIEVGSLRPAQALLDRAP